MRAKLQNSGDDRAVRAMLEKHLESDDSDEITNPWLRRAHQALRRASKGGREAGEHASADSGEEPPPFDEHDRAQGMWAVRQARELLASIFTAASARDDQQAAAALSRHLEQFSREELRTICDALQMFETAGGFVLAKLDERIRATQPPRRPRPKHPKTRTDKKDTP